MARSSFASHGRNTASQQIDVTAVGTTPPALRDRYRASLPWVEVLDALEAIPKLQAAETRSDIDAGEAFIELVGADNDAVTEGLEDLRQGLPRWGVKVVKATHAEGRVSISPRLIDQLRPRTAPTK